MADKDVASANSFDGSHRIDISINENGVQAAIRKVNQAAAAMMLLDKEAAMSLRGEALRLGEHLESICKGAAIVAAQTAVQVSPVDTGMMRANWQFSSGKGRFRAYEVMATDIQGVETIERLTAEIQISERQPGESYFIYNAAHHAKALEEGWSSQAPGGMTRLAAQAAEAYVTRQRIEKRGKL